LCVSVSTFPVQTEAQPDDVRFSPGTLRRRFQKTQAESHNSRDKKVTELLPFAAPTGTILR